MRAVILENSKLTYGSTPDLASVMVMTEHHKMAALFQIWCTSSVEAPIRPSLQLHVGLRNPLPTDACSVTEVTEVMILIYIAVLWPRGQVATVR